MDMEEASNLKKRRLLANDLDRQDCLVDSESTELQEETELECKPFFVNLLGLPAEQIAHLRQVGLLPKNYTTSDDDDDESYDVCLLRDKHANYLSKAFGRLPSGFASQDAARPWMLYWCLHGCDLLNQLPKPADSDLTITETSSDRENKGGDSNNNNVLLGMVHTLRAFWQDIPVEDLPDHLEPSVQQDPLLKNFKGPAGGFGGSPMQMAHCAPTYAAVLVLAIIATDDEGKGDHQQAARQLLRQKRLPLYRWFRSLQDPIGGGFRMHLDGEIDVRATYCMFVCAKLLDIVGNLGSSLTVKFLQDCQTYEGGFGGEPFSEAHGGYSFCAMAALVLLDKLNSVDTDALLGWLARRQMAYEGGFQGRCNKLVDGCYSFWQGSAMTVVSKYLQQGTDEVPNDQSPRDPWLAEFVERSGIGRGQTEDSVDGNAAQTQEALFDEAMLQRYILLCAQEVNGGLRDKPSKPPDFYHTCYNLSGLSASQQQHAGLISFGHSQTKLAATHPVYNIRIERVHQMLGIDWEAPL